MTDSRSNFRLFLLAGLVTTCLLGGLATWLSIGESLQRLQRDSLTARAHEISGTIESRIGDFVNGLEYLARRPRLISTVIGDETEIENVRDEVRSFDLYDDLVALRLVDVLGDVILAETLPRINTPGFTGDAPKDREMVEAALASDGDPTVRISYLGHRGLDYFTAAVPVLRNGGTEGVLLGTFRLDLTKYRNMDEQLVGLTVGAPREPGQTVVDGYISTSTNLADGHLSIHLLWSLDRFAEVRQHLVLVVTGSLLLGLLLAFGGLAWVGQRIILAPQRALESSRAALAHSEAKARELAVIAESSFDTITINDADGRVLWANPAFAEKWGFSISEVIGRDALALRTGPKTRLDDPWHTISQSGAYFGENTYYSKEGTPIEVLVSIQSLPGDNGQPDKFLVICRDITEIKRREAELEITRAEATEARRQLEEAIEALDDGFVFYDTDDRLVTCNQAYKRILGDTLSSFEPGRTYRELLTEFAYSSVLPDAVGKEEEFVERMMAERNAGVGHEITHETENGTWIYQRDQRTPSGAIVGLRMDVTEMKRREVELEDARAKAEAANHAKSNFLANMSHEIRTPMNGIIGMCELLNETELNDEQSLCARTINSSAEALLSIINNILDFSKIEAGKEEIRAEPFSLHNAVYDVARLLHPTAHEKNIEICVDFDDRLSEHFIGDIGRIRQILINLLGNAVKFTESGYVLVAVGPNEDRAESITIMVEDTGIGIPQHKLDRIFQAFEQVDNESTRQHDGTGLGLAITKRLVEAMGGETSVESEVGRGSRFTLEVPLQATDSPDQAKSADSANTESECRRLLAGKRVLIVDDLHVNRYILEKRMSRLGAIPICIGTGEEALDHVLESSNADDAGIDLAILDHQMPHMDGETLMVALSGRTGTPPFPTVLYSSMDFSIDNRRLEALGFNAVLLKPASRKALCRTLVTALGGQATATPNRPRAGNDSPGNTVSDSPAHKLRVMAADDNRTNQLVLQKMLAAFPVSLEIFSNGEEILDAYVNRGADVIFMDVSMPVMGGLEATEAIRAHETSTGAAPCPIVALTAKAMKHHRQECMDAGMDDFLTKPIKKAALAEALERHGGSGAVASGQAGEVEARHSA